MRCFLDMEIYRDFIDMLDDDMLTESSETSDDAEDADVDSDYEPSRRLKDPSSEKSSHTRSCPSSPAGIPETSTPSNSDESDSKKTPQSSGAGDPKASTKRQRSSSFAYLRGLGSAEKPIDVDDVASLFEPVAIREYVWQSILHFPDAEITLQVKMEEISLPTRANPQIKGTRSYTVYDVTGAPKTFTPSFHVSCKSLISFFY